LRSRQPYRAGEFKERLFPESAEAAHDLGDLSLQPGTNGERLDDCSEPSNANLSFVLPFQSPPGRVEHTDQRSRRQLVSTKELSEIWGAPESTLRYWRSAETGPPYVRLGGRIKYDLADVELCVRANKRIQDAVL
jgi:hypothetical protein